MPVYEYKCKACGRELEVQQRMSDPDLTDCPECGKPELERLISMTAFQLKGSGWYKDLYASAKPDAKSETKPADSKPAESSSSTPAASTSSSSDSGSASSSSSGPSGSSGSSGSGSGAGGSGSSSGTSGGSTSKAAAGAS